MHISLDSALGRQRRLNSVGESVFQIAPNAAAGYSLRSLTGGDPAVVRVRRESDNAERDFNSSGVSSGELVNWVNQQITPPLDLRELTATGRDGPIIDAAVAYSLRNLSDSYTGNVVEVRRSSDDATRSFTAAEVADGTLTDWVNTDLGITFGTAEPTTSGAAVTNASSTGFTYSSSSTSVKGARLPFSQSIPAGAKISITLTTSNKVGGVTPSVRLASDSSSQLAPSATPSLFTSNANGTQTFIGTTTSTTTSLAFFDNVIGSFDVSNVTINYIVYDGTVSTWYDQSTTAGTPNANHAVQTDAASQPKIVDAGSLVTGGLDFDGTDDFFDITPISTSSTALSTFIFGDAQPSVFSYPIGNNNNAGIGVSSTQFRYNLISGTPILEDWPSTLSGQNLYTFIHDGTTGIPNTSGYRNGAIGSQTSATQGAAPSDFIRYIGTRNQVQDFVGVIGELIIYNSDQTDNRTALEANIGEVYSIAGIPAYDDTVNGFVETWYDQSGNGNDAVQFTASSQPKIVDAGTLVSGGLDFDGVDDFFSLGDLSLSQPNSVVFVHNSDTDGAINVNKNDFLDGTSVSSGRTLIDQSSTFYRVFAGASAITSLPIAANQNRLVFTTLNDGSSEFSLNGSNETGLTAGTNGMAEMTLGASISGGRYDGTFAEFIIYPSDQSANRVAIETNLIIHYDI